jgi:hypothetical protein
MYSLAQSKRIRGDSGEPLPVVFEALEARGVRLLRGQLALVAAGPGTGKSAFVLSYLLQAKVPTLYFSADSDAFTQLTRSISMLKGWPLEKSAHAVLDDDMEAVDASLADVPIRMVYDASPSLDRIQEVMTSWFEVYEDYPHVVVIDNVTNVRSGSAANDDDPFSGLESLMEYLHDMARNTQACVIGLHHVTGGYNDADKPIPLSGVKGQITRVPELVLTLFKKFDAMYNITKLCVSAVKNRAGKADPSGNTFAELEFIGDQMTIRDLPDDYKPDFGQVEIDDPWQESEDDDDEENDLWR